MGKGARPYGRRAPCARRRGGRAAALEAGARPRPCERSSARASSRHCAAARPTAASAGAELTAQGGRRRRRARRSRSGGPRRPVRLLDVHLVGSGATDAEAWVAQRGRARGARREGPRSPTRAPPCTWSRARARPRGARRGADGALRLHGRDGVAAEGVQGERKGRGRIARAARRVGRGEELRRRLPPRVAPPPRRRRGQGRGVRGGARAVRPRHPILAAADRAEAYRQLAAIHTGYDRHADARALLDAAVDEAEAADHATKGAACDAAVALLHARALCSAKLGERARALADAVATARARPGWVDALVSVGRAYAALGDWEKATPPWERALAEQPGNTLLRRDLERAKMEAAHGGGAKSGAPSEGAGEAEGAATTTRARRRGAARRWPSRNWRTRRRAASSSGAPSSI